MLVQRKISQLEDHLIREYFYNRKELKGDTGMYQATGMIVAGSNTDETNGNKMEF
jgi:hypothetical protein